MISYTIVLSLTAVMAAQPPTPTALQTKSPDAAPQKAESGKGLTAVPLVKAKPTLSPKQKKFEDTLREAELLYDKDKLDEARALFEKAIAINPQDPEAYIRAGSCYFASNNIDKAIEMLKRASELDPNNSFIYYQIGRCYSSKEQWDMAIIQYKKAIKDNPKNAVANFELGSTYFVKRDFENAKKHYEEAAKLFGYDTTRGKESLRNAIKVEMLMEQM
jgi:tetratricopeptide (TPR) repeat protein